VLAGFLFLRRTEGLFILIKETLPEPTPQGILQDFVSRC